MTSALIPLTSPDLSVWPTLLLLAPAATAAAASLGVRSAPVARAWRTARATSWTIAAAATAIAVTRAVIGGRANGLVRLDTVAATVVLLVALVGAVVVRYSSVYLAGDLNERRYVRRLLATLAAVCLVVVANQVLLLMGAWAATSLALHGLLVHYGERPVAVAVAHKKFLLARVADACMLGAAIAFGTTFSTLRIDVVVARAVAAPELAVGARVGILLIAVAAVLKCAQLPFHGWLIQVMEAPTPVSALLHAGVVNLGGVVLLRFAPVVDRAVETRSLLVAIGLLTSVAASLVMTTRVSVKVALAWSTCAQMGFMLLECGLGLWQMALLHLLAHSVYKAHAFLGAGGTVRRTQRVQLAPSHGTPQLSDLVIGAAVSAAGTTAVGALWAAIPGTEPLSTAAWVLLGVVALALVPLSTPSHGRSHVLPVARGVAIAAVYVALHELAGRLVPQARTVPVALVVLAGVGFAGLFVAQVARDVAPHGLVAKRMLPWIYAGLFLDDAFTRLAFSMSRPPKAVAGWSPLLPRRAVVLAGVDAPVTASTARRAATPDVLDARPESPAALATLPERSHA